MRTKHDTLVKGIAMLILFAFVGLYEGCKKDETPIAPYDPGPTPQVLSSLAVEGGAYAPRVSWVGGYVSAVGVNSGTVARLDTSLLWLIHQAGNGIHYQPQFGRLPAGAEDITTAYGGHPVANLAEDKVYTFWLAKDDVWGALTANPGKVLVADTTLSSGVRQSNDTLFVSARSFISRVNPIDLYIGIRNVYSVGKLGTITVKQTNTNNTPIISFKVTQAGVTDTLVAYIGMCSGSAYDVGSVIWEALAVQDSAGISLYWRRNVIASPVDPLQPIPGTQAFTPYPAEGLQRNTTYLVFIANKNWDQRNRTRTASNYASATFDTY